MKRKTKDAPVYAFTRRGDALVPEFAYDCAALEGIAQGQRVKVSIDNWRNRDRLRAYWALISECVKATECAANAKALHAYVKLQCGIVDVIRLADGTEFAVPGSIAVEEMNEADMQAYFQATERFLASEYGFVAERNAA
jgi:hypothetical protein